MAEIPDVVGGEIIDAGDWGNPIRDRTLQRYVSEAERDVLVPAPTAGTLAYIEALDEVQVFNVPAGWTALIDTLEAGFPWVSLAGDTMGGDLIFTGFGVFDALLKMAGEQITQNTAAEVAMGVDEIGTYRVGNIAAIEDIPGIDVARMEYSQASFNASITTFSTRSASILESQVNPHFRLASADSNENPDKRIAIADEFFGTSGGDDVHTALAGGWWNFQRIVSTVEIKEEIFPWNPLLPMPATIPGPKQAGGAGATPFAPEELMDLTPVTFRLTPDHITARESDPGELLGYIAEDVAAKAPWVLGESGSSMDRDRFAMGVLELIRDLRDRVTTLEP